MEKWRINFFSYRNMLEKFNQRTEKVIKKVHKKTIYLIMGVPPNKEVGKQSKQFNRKKNNKTKNCD